MPEKAPSDRIRHGIEAFVEILDRVEGLEGELRDAEGRGEVYSREVEAMQRVIEEMRSADGVFEDLEDLRRGVRTVDEIYEKWLTSVP